MKNIRPILSLAIAAPLMMLAGTASAQSAAPALGACGQPAVLNSQPMTLESLFWDADRFAQAIDPVAAGESFFASLRSAYAIEPAGAERVIDVGFARAPEARALGVSTTEPVYRIEKLVTDADGSPLALSRTVTPCQLVTLTVKN